MSNAAFPQQMESPMKLKRSNRKSSRKLTPCAWFLDNA